MKVRNQPKLRRVCIKTNIFQNKLIYCRHFRTYSRCAMFDWSDTVFRRRNVTRRRISNTVLQPRRKTTVCAWRHGIFSVHSPMSGYCIVSIGKPRVSPLRFLNTSAVIWYLICVYASHFFAGRLYHFNQTLRTTGKLFIKFEISLFNM
jgi:hypothetical protein